MTDQAQQAILQGAMGVAMALAIGYVLYRIIKTKDSPSKASDYGRNWMAWIVMISTMATLPNAINNPSPDTIAKGVVALIVFSLIAFLVGFAYGKFKLRKANTSTNKPTTNKPVANTDIQGDKIICSECGAEIKPANAKFCGHCGAKVEPPKQVASKTINAEVVKPPAIEKQVVNNDKTPAPVKPVQTTSQSKPITKHTKSKAITRSDSSPYKAIIITFIVLAVFVVALQKYTTSNDERKHLNYNNGKTTEYYEQNGYTWMNTDIYAGWSKDGVYDGYGLVTLKDGSLTYEGEMLNGKFHGKGAFINSDGFGYGGEWKDGEWYGQGIYKWPDGRAYDGEWKDGKKHGYGTFTQADGTKFSGEWTNDSPPVYGVINYTNGTKYEGKLNIKKKE